MGVALAGCDNAVRTHPSGVGVAHSGCRSRTGQGVSDGLVIWQTTSDDDFSGLPTAHACKVGGARFKSACDACIRSLAIVTQNQQSLLLEVTRDHQPQV